MTQFKAVTLCATLCAAPLALLAEKHDIPTAEVADPIETLRTQIDTILTGTRAELVKVEGLLFDDPDDPSLKAIAKDLRENIARLEELKAQLSETVLATDAD